LLWGWLCGPVSLVSDLAVGGLDGGHPLVGGIGRAGERDDLREQFLSSYLGPRCRCGNDPHVYVVRMGGMVGGSPW